MCNINVTIYIYHIHMYTYKYVISMNFRKNIQILDYTISNIKDRSPWATVLSLNDNYNVHPWLSTPWSALIKRTCATGMSQSNEIWTHGIPLAIGMEQRGISMALCKTALPPVRCQWSYCSLALSHRFKVASDYIHLLAMHYLYNKISVMQQFDFCQISDFRSMEMLSKLSSSSLLPFGSRKRY